MYTSTDYQHYNQRQHSTTKTTAQVESSFNSKIIKQQQEQDSNGLCPLEDHFLLHIEKTDATKYLVAVVLVAVVAAVYQGNRCHQLPWKEKIARTATIGKSHNDRNGNDDDSSSICSRRNCLKWHLSISRCPIHNNTTTTNNNYYYNNNSNNSSNNNNIAVAL